MSWDVVKLGEKVNFIGGSQPAKSNFVYEEKDGYVRLLQIRDYKSNKNLTFIPKDSTKKFCSKEDVMIGRYGPPIFQILRGLQGAYNVALMKAQPKEGVDREYLYHFLKQQNLFRLLDSLSQRTAGQSGVDMDTLKNYPFPLPPLPTQKKIVEILDCAQGLIDTRKKQITQMDQLVQSLFYDMFGDPVKNPKGWETVKLGQLGRWFSGGTPSRKNAEYWKGEIPWISAKSMKSMWLYNSIENLSKAGAKNGSKLVPLGTILFVVRGMSLAKEFRVGMAMRELAFNQDVKAIVPNEAIIPEYLLFHLLQANSGIMNLVDTASHGTKKLNTDELQKWSVPLPPITLQNKFASRVEKIEAQKAHMVASLKELEDNFNSLMQRAFKGELV